MMITNEAHRSNAAAPPVDAARVTPQPTKGRVLVVDDELAILRTFARVLGSGGYTVITATDGVAAKALIDHERFDVILSDICLPGLSGIELLRAARQRDLDVPVVLLTGTPSEDGPDEAVELGALLYLVKPIEVRSLIQVVDHAAHLHKLARFRRSTTAPHGAPLLRSGDRVELEASFARAIASIRMAYQPIVRWSRREVFGYEALVRNDDPVLSSPAALIEAAERLSRVRDLGRIVRDHVARGIAAAPPEARIFVNLHTRDLADATLLLPSSPLSRHASRVVLELTERASLDEVGDVASRVTALRNLGFRIAVDDLGAGYAGLTAFAQLKPEVVKLDMSLVRDVQREPVKRRLIAAMSSLCRDMGMLVVAEGVETAEERDALAGIGCDLMQGYLFGKPEPRFATVRF